ncbi:MAG: hypothetical protein COB09_08170 [Thalassobium sp.]|nr:MAG: hypothetical protein COB09_08170 [Thalassobium sp.]
MAEEKGKRKTKRTPVKVKAVEEPAPGAGGRPTKYKPEYCTEVIEFFDQEPFIMATKVDEEGSEVPVLDKHGNPVLIPCKFPTKEGFARKVGVCRDTIHEWEKTYPEFSDAIKKAETIQKDILIQNGLLGNYEKTFAIFVAKNVTDMRDKQELSVTEEKPTEQLSDEELNAEIERRLTAAASSSAS